MKKRTWLKTVGLAGAISLILVFAGFRAHAFLPDRFGPRPLKDLDLTKEQKTQIVGILKKYQPRMEGLGDELLKLAHPATAPQTAGFDENNARLAFQQMSPTLEEMYVLKEKIKSEVKLVLTDEQVAQVAEKWEKWLSKRGDRVKFRRAMLDSWLEMDME